MAFDHGGGRRVYTLVAVQRSRCRVSAFAWLFLTMSVVRDHECGRVVQHVLLPLLRCDCWLSKKEQKVEAYFETLRLFPTGSRENG